MDVTLKYPTKEFAYTGTCHAAISEKCAELSAKITMQ